MQSPARIPEPGQVLQVNVFAFKKNNAVTCANNGAWPGVASERICFQEEQCSQLCEYRGLSVNVLYTNIL